MWAKIAAAFGTPILVTLLVGGVLVATHHTVVPAIALPSAAATANLAASTESPKPIPPGPCIGKIPAHFAGIAVKRRIDENSATFAKATGRSPQIIEFYNPFLNPFAEREALKVIKAGRIPLIQLNPRNVTSRQIAAGVYDHHLTAYANAVRSFGCVIVLSLGHEMNGWWYPWGSTGGTTPAEFIAAWRHVHDVFAKQHADNVIWSWDPTHQYKSPTPGKVATPASEWYPGKDYVDWIGIDGYLNYDINGHPQNFKEIFGYELSDIRRIAPHKLIYLAETAVSPGSAALKQIDNLFAGLSQYHLAGLIWFDALGRADQTGKRKDFRLQQKERAEDAALYNKLLSRFLRQGVL
jgi:mannan endo-1,4-beta-mannosidase